MDFVPMLALGALIYKTVDFLKYLVDRNWNAVLTQTVAWVAGVVAVFLFSFTQFAAGVDVGGTVLSDMGVADRVVVGLLATSIFSAVYDFKSAFDNTDSAQTPKMMK